MLMPQRRRVIIEVCQSELVGRKFPETSAKVGKT